MPSEIKLCAFDIETRGHVPEFVSGAIVSDCSQQFFETATGMIEHLRWHARNKYTLVAHNAEYDVAVLLWGQGEDVRIDYTNGLYTCAWWRFGPGTRSAPIWDSLKLAAGLPLSELGRSIGVPKLNTPRRLLDPEDVRQDWVCEVHNSIGCVECYNLRDTQIVWGYMNMLREWLKGYGVSLRRSLPSIAMGLWKLWDAGKQQTPRTKRIRELGRLAYHGGRCEVFKYGSVVLPNTYDIRRFYGSLLLTAQLPDIGSLEYAESTTSALLPEDGDGAVEATVTIESQYCPPLPVAAEGRMWFPVGKCRGVWPLSELRASLVHGVSLHQIHRIAHTRRLHTPFGTTAAVLLELGEDWRRQGDPRELLIKFILNAVIGRLGLRDVSERTSFRRWRKGMTKDDFKGTEVESADGAVYLARRWNLDKPAPLTNAMWAAVICGQGRLRLYDYLLAAGSTLLYCDTDGVHCTRQISVGTDSPGQLVDKGTYDKGLYLAPKMYRLEKWDGTTETRAKGIPRRNAEAFLRDGATTYQTSIGVVEAISKGIAPATWIDVERISHYAPGTRTILDPQAIDQPDRSSDTAPVVFQMTGPDKMELAG